ncbi:MAG: type III PLP-dependent enzyme [Caldilineaceae bacterium]
MPYHRFLPNNVRSNFHNLVQPINYTDDDLRIIDDSQTPLLVIDCEQIRQNVRAIRRALPGVMVYYALKCNPDAEIVRTLAEMGVGFEIASLQEAMFLQQLDVPPSQIVCFHTIKSPAFLQYLHEHRIDIMAVDSVEELDKIAAYAPHSRIVARVEVPNDGSVVDLSGKFGIAPAEAPILFRHALALGLKPYGITMHVGSQCVQLRAWERAVQICFAAWMEARKHGIDLELFSLGGGLPAPYRAPVLPLSEIGEMLARYDLAKLHNGRGLVTVEPGRAIAATAGTIVTSVIGLAKRSNGQWAYLDVGIFNGLMEALLNDDYDFYPIVVPHSDRPKRRYHLGGPTCDSVDTPFRDVELPELRIGDRLYILYTGAYSASCAGSFNGFLPPSIIYLSQTPQPAEKPHVLDVSLEEEIAELADSLFMQRRQAAWDETPVP